MSTVYCPSCEEELDLDEEYREWTVRCPHCQHQFVPSKAGRDPRDREPEEEDEYDDDYVYGYDEVDRRKALDLARAPAIAMEILGWGGVVLSLLVGFGLVADVMIEGNVQNADEGLMVVAGCMAVFGLPCSFVIAWGGRHMRNLTSYGWALTASILCIVMLPLLGCLGILHGALGIWAIVMTQNRTVRRGFDFGKRRRPMWD